LLAQNPDPVCAIRENYSIISFSPVRKERCAQTMATPTTSAFKGYEELIRTPLEHADPRSFTLIGKLLEGYQDQPGAGPFSFLINTLSTVVISPREARNHWEKILDHKKRLEVRLSRTVNIRTACIDYYDQLGIDMTPSAASALERKSAGAATSPAGFTQKSDGHPYQERLREEMMRAKRYKHALSVVLFDVDLGGAAPEIADRALTLIMKLINKAVRTVDILARHADGSILLVLPNTNKREALELAERLKSNICLRVNRVPELSAENVRIAIALGQCSKEDTSADFIKRLERLAETGGRTAEAAIRVLE
jgi:diguanylate cyclase (GGDEF)-like protein